jgi:4-hydroxybenzoate polyprenyltransferase
LNRIVDEEDKFNNLKRWQFFNGTTKRFCFWMSTAAILLASPVIISLLLRKIEVALVFALICISGLFYSVRLLPWFFKNEIRWFSFKDIPILKSLIVCVLWSVSAFLIAVVDSQISILRIDILIILMIFFISSLNSTISSDVRDIDGDRIRNIYTIPVLIGAQNSLKMLMAIDIIGIASVTVLFIGNVITLKMLIFSCFILIWAGLSILPQYFLPRKISKTALEIIVDSESIICAICLVMLSFH